MSDLGDLLRRARAHKGVTIREAEKRTRISRNYLSALEAHDFDQLPPRAYARGIVRTYAQFLGLDPSAVLTMFEAATADADDETDEIGVVPAVQPIEIHGHWAPNFAIIIFGLVISVVIFTWLYSAYLRPSDDAVPATIAQPTATPIEETLLDAISLTPTPTESDAEDATPASETGQTEEAAPSADAADDSDSTESLDATATEEVEPASPGPGSEVLPPGISVPAGYYVFAVYAEEEVWVSVTLDGASEEFNGIMQQGSTEIFLAQSATITSGNAAFVRVYVDGEDYGTLGEPWDAIVTYP